MRAMQYELPVSKNTSPEYDTGVEDGAECRRRANKPSIFMLVAFADDYSSGFRAGYFRGDRISLQT